MTVQDVKLKITKKNSVLFKPSDKLKKILSKDQIDSIVSAVSPIMKNSNYAKAIIFTFERLDIEWKKYKKQVESTSSGNTNSHEVISRAEDALGIISMMGAVLVLGLVLYSYYIRKKERRETKIKVEHEKTN